MSAFSNNTLSCRYSWCWIPAILFIFFIIYCIHYIFTSVLISIISWATWICTIIFSIKITSLKRGTNISSWWLGSIEFLSISTILDDACGSWCSYFSILCALNSLVHTFIFLTSCSKSLILCAICWNIYAASSISQTSR